MNVIPRQRPWQRFKTIVADLNPRRLRRQRNELAEIALDLAQTVDAYRMVLPASVTFTEESDAA